MVISIVFNMKKNSNQKPNRTYIGGQAVLEGVMMRGKKAMATAVRDPEGKIQIESERLSSSERKKKISKIPFLRGIVNLFLSLVDGNRVLLRSGEVAEGDQDVSKAEKWLAEQHKIDLNDLFNTLVVVVALALGVGLFIALPQWLVSFTGFQKTGTQGILYNLIEGGIRIVIFVLYILLTTLMPTIKRTYMYHGAEHKTITCFERGLELTTKNVQECKRVHDRCGTTFLFIVMIISILVFSLVNGVVGGYLYTNTKADFFIRLGLKLLLLPVVAGVSYEVLQFLAKKDNWFFTALKAPGLLLQKLTTREPSPDMIECAILAFETVRKMDEDDTIPETTFAVCSKLSDLLKNTKKRFARFDIEEDEAEWIFAIKLGIAKSAVKSEERVLRVHKVKEILSVVDERLTGRPLWYIFGDTDFYGYKIKVDERVLIPRRETEELAYNAVGCLEDGFKVLDLCTGSGAVAIAVKKEAEKKGLNVDVVASDISEDALTLAKENAAENQAEIRFIQSDLFSRFRDRYDVIVSNPPYIPTGDILSLQREVKDHEPHLALDGGEDGLDFYKKIAENASKYLNRDGVVLLEVGIGQAEKVAKLFKYANYTMILKDMQGVNRFVKVVF